VLARALALAPLANTVRPVGGTLNRSGAGDGNGDDHIRWR